VEPYEKDDGNSPSFQLHEATHGRDTVQKMSWDNNAKSLEPEYLIVIIAQQQHTLWMFRFLKTRI